MRYKEGLFFQGIESKGAVRNRPELLEKAYEFGKSIAKGNRAEGR
jgi:hypothetical protein